MDRNNQVFSDSENSQPSQPSPPGQAATSNENAYHAQFCVHPTVFFYRPPNDLYHYLINCKEIPYDIVERLLKKLFNDKENVTQLKEDEYVFFYQQKCNNRFYQVSCEIVSPLLVNNCLNKNFLGVELQQLEQEHLAFTFDQKEYLEKHLKNYLNQYLLN